MKVRVVVFPGTNCDQDVVHLYQNLLGCSVKVVWHRDTDLKGSPDLVIIPGGFSYGDYLRAGALARVSPIMHEVRTFAQKGGSVIGVCNGFQILCETGLLPGVLLQNVGMRFLSRFVSLRVESDNTPMTNGITPGTVIRCPIAHFEGNYFVSGDQLKEIQDQDQIIFRYCRADGSVDPQDLESNPNGSISAIAGVCSRGRNVVGLMPHPERSVEGAIGGEGSESGRILFSSLDGVKQRFKKAS